MIKITNKFEEINHIRLYCEGRYGYTSGLKKTKDLIEDIQSRQLHSEKVQIVNDIFANMQDTDVRTILEQVLALRNLKVLARY